MRCLKGQGLMGMSARENRRRMGWVRRHGPGSGPLRPLRCALIPHPIPAAIEPEGSQGQTQRGRASWMRAAAVTLRWINKGSRFNGCPPEAGCLCNLAVIESMLCFYPPLYLNNAAWTPVLPQLLHGTMEKKDLFKGWLSYWGQFYGALSKSQTWKQQLILDESSRLFPKCCPLGPRMPGIMSGSWNNLLGVWTSQPQIAAILPTLQLLYTCAQLCQRKSPFVWEKVTRISHPMKGEIVCMGHVPVSA